MQKLIAPKTTFKSREDTDKRCNDRSVQDMWVVRQGTRLALVLQAFDGRVFAQLLQDEWLRTPFPKGISVGGWRGARYSLVSSYSGKYDVPVAKQVLAVTLDANNFIHILYRPRHNSHPHLWVVRPFCHDIRGTGSTPWAPGLRHCDYSCSTCYQWGDARGYGKGRPTDGPWMREKWDQLEQPLTVLPANLVPDAELQTVERPASLPLFVPFHVPSKADDPAPGRFEVIRLAGMVHYEKGAYGKGVPGQPSQMRGDPWKPGTASPFVRITRPFGGSTNSVPPACNSFTQNGGGGIHTRRRLAAGYDPQATWSIDKVLHYTSLSAALPNTSAREPED